MELKADRGITYFEEMHGFSFALSTGIADDSKNGAHRLRGRYGKGGRSQMQDKVRCGEQSRSIS